MIKKLVSLWRRWRIHRGLAVATRLIEEVGYANAAELYFSTCPSKFTDDYYDRGFLLALKMKQADMYGMTIEVTNSAGESASYEGKSNV